MAQTVAERLAGVHPKMLAASSEADRKRLAEGQRRAVGQAIERAIVLAGLTKQDVAFRMGYEDQTALARWISGVENPQFFRLFALNELRGSLVIALAELAGQDVITRIEVRKVPA